MDTYSYILPVKIISCSENVTGAQNLFSLNEMQISMHEEKYVKFSGKGYLILDFGREYVGMLRLITYRVKNENYCTKARIRFGESVTECCAEIGEKNLVDHHSVHGGYYDVPNLSDQCIGDTAFRFVRIDILEDCEVLIKNILLVWRHCGLFCRGKFESDDLLLNKIYSVALDTVYLTMQNDVIWDGVKRDRLVWGGDLNPEIKSILCGYGNVPCIRNSLTAVRKGAPLPAWVNDIPSYSMWWIINLYDYYMFSGDDNYLLENLDYLEGVIDLFSKCFTVDGEILVEKNAVSCDMPWFLDWPTYGSGSEKEGVKALYKVALDCGAFLLQKAGLSGEICRSLNLKIKLENTGSYAKSVLAMRLWAGTHDNAFAELEKNGATDISTFMSYYILKAMSKTGNTDRAVEIAKEYFGGMLSRGATTFWEDFNISWLLGSGRIDAFPKEGEKDLHGDFGAFCYKGFRHSLCHGWASGVAAFLVEDVAGIKVQECGCKTILVEPKLGNIKELDAIYPLPDGELHVTCKKTKSGKIEIKTEQPENVKILWRGN